MNFSVDSLEFSEDRVSALKVRWGLERRPMWETLQAQRPAIAIKWCDRFSAHEGVPAEWALAQAFESALEIEVPVRTDVLRFFYCEMQRLIWGLSYVCGVFRAVHDSIRLEQAQYLRELAYGAQETISGSRVLPQLLRLGGVDRDMTAGEAKKARGLIQQIESEMNFSFGRIEEDFLLHNSLQEVLPISSDVVKFLTWGGPVGLASGYHDQIRRQWAARLKLALDVEDYVDPLGTLEGRVGADALSRFRAALFMVRQSLRSSIAILKSLPEGPVYAKGCEDSTIFSIQSEDLPEGTFHGFVEAGSGLLSACVSRDAIRLSSSSVRAAPYIETIMTGVHREDLGVAIASLGFDISQGDLAE